MNKQIIIRNR